MRLLLALAVAVLFGSGAYLLLRRSVVRLLIGLSLIAHGANLVVFAAAAPLSEHPPIVPPGATTLSAASTADPLPQAMILTAIVIGFAVVAFAVVLVYRVSRVSDTDDVDDLRSER